MIAPIEFCPSLEKKGPSLPDEKWALPRWFAVYTKSRHEKALEDELGKKKNETFLPVRRVVRHWSDRKKIIEDPLFKSYLFVKVFWRDRWSVLNTHGAVRFVTTGLSHGPIEVPERELLTIKNFIDGEMNVDPFPYLKEGERVYIKSGPFKGAEGFIVRKDRNCRLVISLDMLMQSVSVVIDEALIEKV
jgi:transcription antitermination factor NusG